MSDERRTRSGSEAAVHLGKEYIQDVRADELRVELRSGRELTVDVVDGELRIREFDQ